MLNFELANHEYIITCSTEDTLSSIGITQEKVNENPALIKGLKMAINRQWKNI